MRSYERLRRLGMDDFVDMVGKKARYPGEKVLDLVYGRNWYETDIVCHIEKDKNGEEKKSYRLKRVTELLEEIYPIGNKSNMAPYNQCEEAAKIVAKKFLEKHRGLVVGKAMGLI